MTVEPRTLKFVADAADGEILHGSPNLSIRGIRTDSRAVGAGDLFVALQGEKADGHDYVSQALKLGAAALMLHRREAAEASAASVLVQNTRTALGRLGAAYRNDFNIPLIAVGGANGKTSTKELIGAVLARQGPTLWSEASFNNDLGVPLTLLRLASSHHAGVLEVGTNHPGELATLLLMVRPKYGVITNIGREHLEFFGDLAGVAREEGFMAEALPAGGMLLVNGDSPEMGQILRRTKARILKIGYESGNDWRCRNVKVETEGTLFTVETKDKAYSGSYRIKLLGAHQALNALFAIALGREFGLSKTQIEEGLMACKGAKMRLQSRTAGPWTILDDTYNANPDSVGAALQALKDYPGGPKRIAVLGDMGELGEASEREHQAIGAAAEKMGVDALVITGKFSDVVARGAREAGLKQVQVCTDVNEAASQTLNMMQDGSGVVLVKASRAAQFERVVDGLWKVLGTERTQ